MKDTRSLLLALLSVGLVGTWVYHLYDKSFYSNQTKEIYVKDSAAVAQAVKDSMQHLYSQTVNGLNTQLDSTISNADSIKLESDKRLSEVFRLRNEINRILKNKNASPSDISKAAKMVSELRGKIDSLKQQNNSLEDERSRLNNELGSLTDEMKSLQNNVQQLGQENKNLSDKLNEASVFFTSEIRLAAIQVKGSGSKEIETHLAKRTDKFVVSFIVQNNIVQDNNAEVVVVITDPKGQVIQNSVWESGTFDTQTQGRKSFTRRLKFEYNKGEQKRLLFSLEANDYYKGDYKMQVFHKGFLVGNITKTLN
jgi:predicted  nucleic acid-binding Zn-ribbon protein